MFIEYAHRLALLSGGSDLTGDGFLPNLLLGVVVAWIGWVAATSGFESVREWWTILRSESLSIDAALATGGLVQLQGRVRPLHPDATLTSPIRNRECVAYEYTISKVVQDSGESSLDADTAYRSFVLTDGTGEILVDPDEASLSLTTTTERTTKTEVIRERTADASVEFDPAAAIADDGTIPKPIEFREGTISPGEEVTVVGKATPVSEEVPGDANAVMTAETDQLTVMTDPPGNTAMRNAARGVFLLVLGALFVLFAIGILRAALLDIL